MNNQTSTTETQKNYKKFFSILKKTHLIIPVISLISVALGLFIGFATALHWSIVVTGTTDQTGYLFGRLAVPMGIIVLAILIIYSILPFLLGSLATIMTSYESLKKISPKHHLVISIIVAAIYLISCFLLNNSIWLLLAIGMVFFFWRCVYYFDGSEYEESKNKSAYDNIKNIINMFIFAAIALASVLVGLLILLNYTRVASIGYSKTDYNILYFLLFLLSYVFTASGVIYAAIGKELNIPFVTFVVFCIGFVIILSDIPQNTLISLNHGILPTPKKLQSAIKLATKKVKNKGTESKNAKCTAMHIITHKNYRLFSCGTQKNSWKGKIFYEKMPYTYINKVTNKNEIISKYYCFTTGENGMYLHCISRDSLVPR